MRAIDETAQFSNAASQVPSARHKSACLVRLHPAGGSGESVCDLHDQELNLGRDPVCELTLSDPRVSRKHAVIRREAAEYVLEDLGSTNGTFVNDERITRKQLTAGDMIRVGDHIFKFLAGGHVELMFHKETAKIVSCDSLTSAFTKRYFLDRLEEEIARSGRAERALSLLMLDIDFFKKINDTYGHPTGDEVLREFSRRIRAVIHRDDVFARYGGEEFAILLPCTNIREAIQIAERCRRAIADEAFSTSTAKFEVTCSVGAATLNGDVNGSETLIAAADERLYEAKRSGRNRVSC